MKRQNLTLPGPWGRVKSANFGFSYVSGPLISMDPIDPIDPIDPVQGPLKSMEGKSLCQ